MEAATLRRGLVLFSFLSTVCTAQDPIQIPFSDSTYGFDGPWNAVSLTIGDPSQDIDLIPGGIWYTAVLARDFCNNVTFSTLGVDCYARSSGLYDNSTSDTAVASGLPVGYPSWTGGSPPMNGESYNNYDQMGFGNDHSIANVSLLFVDWAYEIFPDGRQLPMPAGSLSLGAPAVNQILPNSDIAGSLPPNQFFADGVTPSASVGLHLGSASSLIEGGIPGSLWFGGYDSSRIIGPVGTQPITGTGATFAIDLQAIDYTTPTDQSNVPLDQMSSAFSGSTISVGIAPWSPYLTVPKTMCDALVADLPVVYNESLGFYIWNQSDPRYSKNFVKSKSYFTFTFSSTSEIPIKIPLALLHLSLTAPVVAQEEFYFPCVPSTNGDTFMLGQALLQAAMFGVHWLPDNEAEAYWWIAQAPGPNVASTPRTMNVLSSDTQSTSLVSGTDSWDESWSNFFVGSQDSSSPTNSGSSPQQSSDTGLSSGAKAGIGVGVAVAVVLLIALGVVFFLRRRRQQKRGAPRGGPEMQGVKHAELDGDASSGDEMLGQRGIRSADADIHQSPAGTWRPSDYGSGPVSAVAPTTASPDDDSPGGRYNPVEAVTREKRQELPAEASEKRTELDSHQAPVELP